MFYSHVIANTHSINKIIRKIKDFVEGVSLLKQIHIQKKTTAKLIGLFCGRIGELTIIQEA